MHNDKAIPNPVSRRQIHIVDLSYLSRYIKDFQEAIAFYSRVFGAPESIAENKTNYVWRMGSTWLPLFPSNVEFAIRVSTAEEVDLLHQALIDAGATFLSIALI